MELCSKQVGPDKAILEYHSVKEFWGVFVDPPSVNSQFSNQK